MPNAPRITKGSQHSVQARSKHSELEGQVPEASTGAAIQLKASLRGKDFASQEGLLAPQAGAAPTAVQRKGGGEAEAAITHEQAAAGTRGAGGPIPHLAAIQRSFGRHDVSGIQAHTGGDAAGAARSMGAEAYASGNHVAFANAPSLHTAAHEAAHVVQQRAGVQLEGGVGVAGDTYERHADKVAAKVVKGESAESLLDVHAGGKGPAGPEQGPSQAPTQRKIQFKGGRGKGKHKNRRGGGGAKSTALTVYQGQKPTTAPKAKAPEKSTALTVYQGGTPTQGGTSQSASEKSTALTVYQGGTPTQGGPSQTTPEKSTALTVYNGGKPAPEQSPTSTALVTTGGQQPSEMCSPSDKPAPPLMLADRAHSEIVAEQELNANCERVGMGLDAGADILDVVEAVSKFQEARQSGDKVGQVTSGTTAVGATISATSNIGGASGLLSNGTMDKAGAAAGALKIVNQANEAYLAVFDAYEAFKTSGFSEEFAIKTGAVIEKLCDAAGSGLAVAKAISASEVIGTLGPIADGIKRAVIIFERVLQARIAWRRWDEAIKDKNNRGRPNERRIKEADDVLAELNRDRFKQDLLEIVVNGAGLAAIISAGPVGSVGAKAAELTSKAYITGLRTAREWGLWWTDQTKTTTGRMALAQEIVNLNVPHLYELAGAAPGANVDDVHKALMEGN